MGGRVLFALSVAAFPEDLPVEVMAAIVGGAAEVVREAGGTLAGGHTIRDPEPKFGLAVVGVGHPDRLLRKGGARPGDVLILTKPLGTGLLVSGARLGRTAPADLEAAIASMRRLNRAAAEVLVAAGVIAATDVTGFGLLGHGLEMARASGARVVLDAASLPALSGALGPRGRRRRDGRSRPQPALHGAGADGRGHGGPELVVLAHDPQTSGGLLASVPPDALQAVEDALHAAGVTSWRIGRVEAASEPGITLE